jgi:glyoxylase-like metal-dependent hydrolase (beta-lactamase superfamily II)
MKIASIALGLYQANCYILKSQGEAVVIDPGEEDDRLLELIGENKVKYVLFTHCHPDHVGGGEFIKRTFNSEILFHRDESCPIKADGFLEDGQVLGFGNASLLVWHTPGHSKGSVIFISEESKSIFTGDLIFAGSIGRVDFPGGSAKEMARSLGRVLKLDGNYTIYPGHGPKTTLEEERRGNPFL